MTTAIREFSETYTDHLWLDFTTEERQAIWQQSEHANNRFRYNTYLNRLCLHTVMTWLEEEAAESDLERVAIWQEESFPAIWEFTTGAAITIGKKRVVLIPSESDNTNELSIPQEWLDIPQWVADYYVGVQIDTEECWAKIWGYASHKQVKERGEYTFLNQTYTLMGSQLTEDIYVMLAAMEFNPVTQAETASLPELSAAEAQGLITRLGQPTPYSPRLDVPFEQWGALIGNDEWRNSLFQKRNAGFIETSVVRLSQWLQQEVQELSEEVRAGWQTLGELVTAQPQMQYRFAAARTKSNSKKLVKVYDLGIKFDSRRLALLINLRQEADDTMTVKVQLHPVDDVDTLPTNLKLAALDNSGNELTSTIAKEGDSIIPLANLEEIESGDNFKIQITLDDFSVIQDFSA